MLAPRVVMMQAAQTLCDVLQVGIVGMLEHSAANKRMQNGLANVCSDLSHSMNAFPVDV
jgi:hypothetical protein